MRYRLRTLLIVAGVAAMLAAALACSGYIAFVKSIKLTPMSVPTPPSEHVCLVLEEAAKRRITFVGTPTVGSNGNITFTSMPGGIAVRFSGLDVRHADGRQLQRVGILP